MKKITQNIFVHRTHDLSFVAAINDSLMRASAIADLLKMMGEDDQQNKVDVYAAAQTIRYEVLDALALVDYYKEELDGIGAPRDASSGIDQ